MVTILKKPLLKYLHHSKYNKGTNSFDQTLWVEWADFKESYYGLKAKFVRSYEITISSKFLSEIQASQSVFGKSLSLTGH